MWLSLIAALTLPGRVIGRNNQLPWHMPADLQHFKQTTLGKPVLMGRKTFTSINKPLPGRQNIIVTRDPALAIPGCTVFHSITEALTALQDQKEVFVIGGEEIFRQTLAQAKYLYLTFIHADIPGDTFFPAWNTQQWQEISRQDHKADMRNRHDYSFVILENVRKNIT